MPVDAHAAPTRFAGIGKRGQPATRAAVLGRDDEAERTAGRARRGSPRERVVSIHARRLGPDRALGDRFHPSQYG